MEKIIKYFGQDMKVGCDRKCNKAWGINSRPKVEFNPEDDNDYAFLSDDELGEAPIDPGTYEGIHGEAKPTHSDEIPNRWCIRECERCAKSNPNESHLPLVFTDYSNRVYNQPWKHK